MNAINRTIYLCRVCGMTFATQNDTFAHFEASHKNVVDEINRSNELKTSDKNRKFQDWYHSHDFHYIKGLNIEEQRKHYCQSTWFHQQEKIDKLHKLIKNFKNGY